MALVDSQRLAAFVLRCHLRFLRSILRTGIDGDVPKIRDVHGCRTTIGEATFVLADRLTAAEYANLENALHEAGELHDVVCGIGPVEETISERASLEKLERVPVERIEFLVRRVVQKDVVLGVCLVSRPASYADEPRVPAESVRARCGFPTFSPP